MESIRVLYRIRRLLAVGLMGIGVCTSLPASTIFNNSSNDLAIGFNPGASEVGDEVKLAGTDRYLTSFSFEYFAINTAHPASFDGTTVTAEVRFYQNTGALFHGYPTPNPTSFWDSGPVTLTALTGRSTLVYSAGSDFPVGGLFLPATDMTWSVHFSGMSGADSVGVDLYAPPTVGTEVGDFGDYWQNNGGWTLLTNTVPMDFAAKFDAVPEPSSMVLALCGGLGLLVLAGRLRRKA